MRLQISSRKPKRELLYADELTEVYDSISKLVDAIRHIGSDLRPPAIDGFGLGAAIQSYTDDWSAHTGVVVQLDLDANLGRLPEAVELSIFRIVREGLCNIRKHAAASTVHINLKHTSPNSLLISIADDGCGMRGDFNLAALATEGHYGLLGISERVALLFGEAPPCLCVVRDDFCSMPALALPPMG